MLFRSESAAAIAVALPTPHAFAATDSLEAAQAAITEAREAANRLAHEVLSNPIIEDFRVEIEE